MNEAEAKLDGMFFGKWGKGEIGRSKFALAPNCR